ncbi:potassium transporter [Dacryopinax primogenitus]|uniref:Potassium transporter n=1 Tax=Dacryopinax primogenitus (strain DJM 731) TaxID=1858805 RepID=M5FVT5_DACPD|nr:potassium transporter [Dacryopinax primogenitus]EJU00469.1 potassium transporter [Dacryopinax primogenitus]
MDAEKGYSSQHRKELHLKGLPLLALAWQTLGIIYADIGTSPLYVLNGIWPSSGDVPSEEDVIGGVSAIIWSLTLLPLLKYVVFSLQFGTEEGEGGPFALFNGLFPKKQYDEDEERALTGDSGVRSSPSSYGPIMRSFKHPMLFWSLFGTALTMADGILTPAVSVTSAVGGIAVAKQSVSNDIIPISIAFLAALFLIQRFGTAKISFIFSPLTVIWLVLIGGSGISNITHYPGIWRAYDPSRAVLWFVRTGNYDYLAGVLLAVTGCEAMFANLGQFNRASIRLSFTSVTYPCLVLAYLGQGARLITDGENAIQNVFYNTIPGPVNGGLWWFTYCFAIFATLIASQTMITAMFSLVQQLINFHSFPPLRMLYTSDVVQGQIYIPTVNWTLGAATIILVGAFQNLTNMTNAYGFAVSTVMIVTSSLIAVQIPMVKRLPWILGVIFLLFFGFFDGLFWGASLRKIPLGAYVPLAIGVVLWSVMIFWTWAKGLEDQFDGVNRHNLRHFIVNAAHLPHGNAGGKDDKLGKSTAVNCTSTTATLIQGSHAEEVEPSTEDDVYSKDGGEGKPDALYLVSEDKTYVRELSRVPIMAVFHKLAGGKGVPHTFYAFLKQWPALPRVVVFLSIKVLPIGHLPVDEERYVITKVRSLKGFYGVTYQIGFREDFNVKVDEIVAGLCAVEARYAQDDEEGERVVREIRTAAETSITHIMPNYWVFSKKINAGFITPVIRYIRAFLIEGLYRQVAQTFPDSVLWRGHQEEIIRVGINAEI